MLNLLNVRTARIFCTIVLSLYVKGRLAVAQDHTNTFEILSDKQVTLLLDSVQYLVSQEYYDKQKASLICARIQEEMNAKKYSGMHRDSLIRSANNNLKNISGDGHLYIQSLRSQPGNSFDWNTFEKEQEIQYNFGFNRIEILDANIGYLKLTQFMHPKRSMPTAVAAMTFLQNTQALIIDLRGNGGGYSGIMEYILNHFFEGEPVELSRTIFSTGRYVTTYSSDLIYGKQRINTPLYVLIDKRTASAAEYFAYTLQAFRKAVILGEKSAGGANRNEYFKLPFGFRLSVSVASPVSAATGTNWEAVGVEPDIATSNPKEEAIALFRARAVAR